eukprot:TRINITY_DN3577_c0_g2_i2.p1 TRINITY_DN3577_c0_g2~~TRINITY_DN3577_c0_g2_i2.p1  ORF type:complete len:346 (-),score=53.39 TRINITY_DN3577_c0_g2_i2:180-1217(-)
MSRDVVERTIVVPIRAVRSLSTRGGTAFGRLTKITRDGNVVQEYPVLPPLATTDPLSLDGLVHGTGIPIRTSDLVDNLGILSLDTLNVHGIAAREDLDLLVTTDFIEPASALVATQAAYNGIRYQPTFRKWKLSTFELVDTWKTLPGSGNLVVHAIPNDPRGRFYGSGVAANKLYLLDPDLDGAHGGVFWSIAIDFDLLGLPKADPHYFILGQDGKGFITLNAADKIVYFDFTNPTSVTIKSIYSQPTGSNPHYLAFYPGGLGGTSSQYDNRFVVINYFLDFKSFGIIHRPGSKIVNVFQWNATHIFPDPLWHNVDFRTLFPENGVTNPHGTAYYYPASLYPNYE